MNAKSFLRSRVPKRRRGLAKDLEKSGVARHVWDFELAMDQQISLVDKAAKKDQVSGALRSS